jgi:hypothetical protein
VSSVSRLPVGSSARMSDGSLPRERKEKERDRSSIVAQARHLSYLLPRAAPTDFIDSRTIRPTVVKWTPKFFAIC